MYLKKSIYRKKFNRSYSFSCAGDYEKLCTAHKLLVSIFIPYSWKIWWGIKFGSLAVWVETAKLKSANFIFTRMCNDVMHALALLDPTRHPSTQAVHIASTLPVTFFVNLQTHGLVQVPKPRGRQHSLVQCLWWCNALRSATTKFKFCQYFFTLGFGPNHQI